MSVKATLKCTGFDVVEPVQFEAVEFPPCSAFQTATGNPAVAVSHTNAILSAPGVVHALVGMISVAFPLLPVPWPKNNRCPTMLSTERYAQMIVGVVSLSHATHNVPPSFGITGLVNDERASAAEADPVQNRAPHSGVVVPRTGSPTVAAIAALGNNADEPTATTGILGACALLIGAHIRTIAAAISAQQSFHRFITFSFLLCRCTVLRIGIAAH
jgi:hypothetical protein